MLPSAPSWAIARVAWSLLSLLSRNLPMKPPSVETILVETKKAVPSNLGAFGARAIGRSTWSERGATVAPRRTKTGSPGRSMMVEEADVEEADAAGADGGATDSEGASTATGVGVGTR